MKANAITLFVNELMQKWKRKLYSEKLEACLDGFLSIFLLELELKQKLEHALQYAAVHTPLPLQNELFHALERYERQGMSLEESLQKMNAVAESPAFARVITLLMHLSKQGVTAQGIAGLKRLQEDLRVQKQVQLKAYGSRLTLLSLVFIGVSALVPAMFLAFVSIGSSFLDLSLSAGDILLISLVGFPLLDGIVLGILWLQTPYFVRVSL